MIANLLKRAYRNGSTIVWAVTLNHLLWGWFFLTQELPLPFGSIHGFSDVSMQSFWGLIFLVVAALSIISDFCKGFLGVSLLIPQQLVVLYGAGEILSALLEDPIPRLVLAACLILPLAIMHAVAVVTRYTREQHGELVKKIARLTETDDQDS